MKQIVLRCLALFLILGLALSAPLMTHDPTGGVGTTTSVQSSQQAPILKYFFSNTLTGPTYSYEITTFNLSATDSKSTITFSNSKAHTLKAISENFNCAILYDATASSEKLKVLKFNTGTTATEVKELIAATIVTAANVPSKTFGVSDLCTAVKMDNSIYHDNGTTFVADTAPTGANPVFNADYNYAAADDGVYSYASGNKTYTRFYNTTLYTKKKLWVVQGKALIFSWADSTTAGETNIKNYKATIIKISDNSVLATIDGKSYHTTANKEPEITFSSGLEVLVISGKSNSTQFFVKGKSLDSTTSTYVDIEFPELVSATESYITVTSQYLYARNTANKGTTTSKYHGGYYINKGKLVSIFESVLGTSEITDWKRSLIDSSRSGELQVYREHINGGIITIEDQRHTPEGQFFRWNKASETTYTVGNLKAAEFEPNWFSYADSGTTRVFQAAYLKPTDNSQIVVKMTATTSFQLKAVSMNKRAALIYDSTATDLKVYDFSKTSSTTILSTGGTVVTASLYTNITISSATFNVADDGKALRINDKIFHWNASSSAFALDNLPSGVTSLSNPAFAGDFSYVVVDGGIWRYASWNYTVDRAETFSGTKTVLKKNKNILIYTYQETTTGSGKYNFVLQPNLILANGSCAKIADVTGQIAELPKVSVSQSLTSFTATGTNSTDATKTAYFAKTVNYQNRTIKDINLTILITGSANTLALSDKYLYGRAISSTLKTHFAYTIMGSTLQPLMSQNISVPFTIAQYNRSWIIPDANKGKLIVAHHFDKDFVRLVKEERKSAAQLIYPGAQGPNEMNFTFAGTLHRSQFPQFGKWVYTTESGTVLNYVEYDPTNNTTKRKNFTKTLTAGNNGIVAVSPTLDCVLARVYLSSFDAIAINSSASTAIIIPARTVVIADNTDSNILASESIDNKIMVGPACWAFKVNNTFYKKNDDGSAFVKISGASAWVNATYDRSMKFAYIPGQLYKWGTNSFDLILNVTGLKTTVQLYGSPDGKKVVFLSYSIENATTNSYSLIAKLYVNTNGSTWLVIDEANYTTAQGKPSFKASPSFDLLGIIFQGGRIKALRPQADFSYINYATNVVKSVNSLPEFNISKSTNYFSMGDTYAYLISAGNQYNQFFYRIDRQNAKFVEIGRRKITLADSLKTKNIQFVTESNNLFVIYEFLKASDNRVQLVKRLIGGNDQQNQIKAIDTNKGGLVIQDGKLMPCPPGCSYCNNPTSCLTCATGFVLDSNNFCLKCSPLCATCTEGDTTTCSSCVTGFYLDSGSCKRCHENCLTCIGSTISSCTSCKVGSFVTSGVCTSCIENCNACTSPSIDTDPLCDTCKIGYVYHPTSKKCIKCIAGCSFCKFDKIYQCDRCENGFEPVYNLTSLITCKRCPDNCKSCIGGNCTECRPGMRVVNNKCVDQCRLPCKDCTDTSPDMCTSCLGGYNLVGNTCVPDLTCNTNKTCTFCPIGYNILVGECVQCRGGDNCRTCDITNIQNCATCVRGYYLTEAQTCANCSIITGCITCDNEAYCTQCKKGYTLSGTNAESTCLKCDDSCETCFESPSNCDLCANGYTKNGWKCVTVSNVKLNLQLAGNFSSFTTDNYMNLEQEICNKVSKDRSQFNVEELKSGSIIVVATIDVSNAAQQAAVSSALSSAFGSGSSLAGFSIESSSFTSVTVDPTADQLKKYKMLVIIVGVAIPGGLIILFIIFFCLYKNGIICAGSNAGSAVNPQINHEDSTFVVQRENGSLGKLKY